MAYQFADGFDNYGNAYTMTAGYPWDSAPNAASVVSTADFRFAPPGSLPGGCLVNGTPTSGNALRKNLTGNQGTLIVGFGFKATALPGSGPCELCSFWDAGTEQCCLTLSNTGALQFYRGSVATPIGSATASATVAANAWYGVAVQVTFSATVGTAQLYINGNAVAAINSTALNNIVTANAYANQVSIGAQINSGPQIKFDDFYCLDTTGGFLNSLLGSDVRIITKMPSSAGNYSNWTPNGLGSNFQNVAVTPPSTADYNANNTATTKDSYTMQSASLGIAPYFVMARASLERDDAGTHNPSIFVRSSATDSAGVATPTLTSSYLFYDAVFQNDPSTAAAWTASGADNAQAGIIEG